MTHLCTSDPVSEGVSHRSHCRLLPSMWLCRWRQAHGLQTAEPCPRLCLPSASVYPTMVHRTPIPGVSHLLHPCFSHWR